VTGGGPFDAARADFSALEAAVDLLAPAGPRARAPLPSRNLDPRLASEFVGHSAARPRFLEMGAPTIACAARAAAFAAAIGGTRFYSVQASPSSNASSVFGELGSDAASALETSTFAALSVVGSWAITPVTGAEAAASLA